MAWLARLRNLVRSDTHSTELDREFDFHIRECADDLISRGMDPAAALAEARRRFGNRGAQKERARDVDLFPLLDSIRGDLRYAFRALAASPVFTIVAVASLALGIGANTAIFSFIDALLLRTLPVVQPNELVRVTLGEESPALSTAEWLELRKRQQVFTGMFAEGNLRSDLSTTGALRPVRGNWVSGEYFTTLGVRPAVGRLIAPQDDHPGCTPVAVLGHAFWKSEFGGDPAAVGKSVALAGRPFRIIGVVEQRFSGTAIGEAQALYAPICAVEVLSPGTMEQRTWYVMARRRPGVTLDEARVALETISRSAMESTVPARLSGERRETYLARRYNLAPGEQGVSYLRMAYGKALYALAGIVAIVLLVACANVANLLLARGTSRRRDVAVRVALGASRARLTRQLVIESLVLALAGSALGIAVAYWGGKVLVNLMSQSFPVSLDLTPDWRLLGFACGVGVLTALLFGVVPAFRETAVDPQDALKAGGRGMVGRHHGLFLGKALVASQVALALVVVTAAGLLLGTFLRLSRQDPGFQVDRILLIGVELGDAGLSDEAEALVYSRFRAGLQAIPSVEAVTSMVLPPIAGVYMGIRVVAPGASGEPIEATPNLNDVGPGYFSTMGMPLVAGRDFTVDDRKDALPVAIINRAAAAKLFPGRNPLGQTFQTSAGKDKLSAPLTVVGVVGDAKYWSLRARTASTIYRPVAQVSFGQLTYAVRSGADPVALTSSVMATAAAVEPRLRLRIRTLSSQMASSLTLEQVLAVLSTFFGALTVLLATIGVYGIMAYGVGRRRNEFGIRIAVGATPGHVVRLVTRDMVVMIGSGLVAGTAIALASTRVLGTFLYEVTPRDPRVLGASVALLIGVALVATLVPALRASRVDPVFALREE